MFGSDRVIDARNGISRRTESHHDVFASVLRPADKSAAVNPDNEGDFFFRLRRQIDVIGV